jgi:hypothetical protein
MSGTFKGHPLDSVMGESRSSRNQLKRSQLFIHNDRIPIEKQHERILISHGWVGE